MHVAAATQRSANLAAIRFAAVVLFVSMAICLCGCSATPSDTQNSSASNQAAEASNQAASSETTNANQTPATAGTLPGVSQAGALRVSGTQLVDAQGNPIQLKGLSTHGLAWFPQYVNEDFFRQIRTEWECNAVRLALYTSEYGGYCTGGNQDQLRELVNNGVQYAINNDMYVIIDWHTLSDNDPRTNQEAAKEFFADMSKRYATVPNVLFEICNEPNGSTTWADIKQYANQVIPIIRENAPNAIILVGTPMWDQSVEQAAADPLTGYSNIMYTLHFYAATHKDDLRGAMSRAHENGLPLFVSEFGICDASGNGAIDEAQANAWTSSLDSLGISYLMWNISNKDETSSIFKPSCTKTSGFDESDLTDAGLWFLKMNSGQLAKSEVASNEANANTAEATQNTGRILRPYE